RNEERQSEKANDSGSIVRRRRNEKRGEQAAVWKPREDAAPVQPLPSPPFSRWRQRPQSQERGKTQEVKEGARDFDREEARHQDVAEHLRAQAFGLDGRPEDGEEPAELDHQEEAGFGHGLQGA